MPKSLVMRLGNVCIETCVMSVPLNVEHKKTLLSNSFKVMSLVGS